MLLRPRLQPPQTLTSKTLFHVTTAAPPPPSISDSGLLFRRKIIYLQTLKVNPTKALLKNPNFRSSPLSLLKSVESCLRSMGVERASLGRILDMFPQLLTSDPYYDLYPVLDFLLNDVSIPFPDVCKSIVRCPRLLVSGVDSQLRPTLRFLRKLGFVGKYAIDCQTTVLLVSNVEGTLLPKVSYLQDLGFSCDEVKNMVLRSPGLLTFSIPNNYEPKVEYFLKEMNRDLEELKRFPQYFSFSLEGKIKPRHQSLMENGIWLTLPEMLKVSDGGFNARLLEMRMQLADRRLSWYFLSFKNELCKNKGTSKGYVGFNSIKNCKYTLWYATIKAINFFASCTLIRTACLIAMLFCKKGSWVMRVL